MLSTIVDRRFLFRVHAQSFVLVSLGKKGIGRLFGMLEVPWRVRVCLTVVLWAYLAMVPRANAFVVMGPLSVSETGNRTQFNLQDDLGIPKSIDREMKRFYRWNIPSFVYSFDASFVGYFGMEGIEAVHDAVEVVNDFFENEDYSGMSQLDLTKHGFAKNYNTSWVNTTAQNQGTDGEPPPHLLHIHPFPVFASAR